jgi:hypothetical protein
VDPNLTDAADRSDPSICYQQRAYPQFDCIGSYLWIWERLIQAEGRPDVVARRVHRERSPGGQEA